MSSLAPCGECNGTGKKGKKHCEWCEGTGLVEIPDGFRPRRTRTKADLKRIEKDQRTPLKASVSADATVIKAPPARMSVTKARE
jgi:RecJ-like exonuclease